MAGDDTRAYARREHDHTEAYESPVAGGGDHAANHASGGGDAVKLDDLAAPDDNTDLDVSTSAHGLAPKAPNDATKYLNGVGGYSVPAGGGGLDAVTLAAHLGTLDKYSKPAPVRLYDSGWHYVGGVGEPAFENSWVNYGSWGDAAFRRIGTIVYLSGLIKNGTNPATMFTLPEGYRISATINGTGGHIFSGHDSSLVNHRIDVYADGKVNANGVSTGYVSLNGIRFITDDPEPRR
jgi:hypothetical protein